MQSLTLTPLLVFVVKRGLPAGLIALLNASLFIDAASAEILTTVGTTREVTTLSTQAHPKRIELAYMVMERHEIGEASIEYRLDRWNWGPVALRSGGQMSGTLKLITKSGTRTVGGKKRAKCEADIFEDERGSFNQRACGLYWEKDLDLEPGDVVLWTVKFKKMPNLEFEPFQDTVYRDRFTLEAGLLPPFD